MANVLFNTNHGDFTLYIDEVNAPVTAANFLQYVRDGHYDGTVFHRVIPNFMVQGGGFAAGMKQKPTRANIAHEGQATSAAGLKNDKGTVAMARTNDPHSGSSQFFINVVNNDFLNFQAPSGNAWGYCVFGKVSAGMDVVEAIRKVPTGSSGGHQDVPREDVLVNSATII
jgi:peptidyl-prolyl cis-trans isomerase B (cyclophilin B)